MGELVWWEVITYIEENYFFWLITLASGKASLGYSCIVQRSAWIWSSSSMYYFLYRVFPLLFHPSWNMGLGTE